MAYTNQNKSTNRSTKNRLRQKASELDSQVFSNPDTEINELLIFTNGKGEPKCIDINRCLTELNADGSVSAAIAGAQAQADFVEACPRVSLAPITFVFSNEGPQRSRFINSKGVQFSYQPIYKKGFFGSLAPYSKLAVPPKFFAAGTDSLSTIEKDVENTCILNIPSQSSEVIGVRLIFREGNDGIARIFDDIYFEEEVSGGSTDFDLSALDDFVGTYKFRNDKTGFLMSETDRLKTFDNVPREAAAQEVTEDRVVYGNYKEGYDNIVVDVETSVEYNEAPPPGYDFDLKAISTVFKRKTNDYTDKDATDDSGTNYANAIDNPDTSENNRISEQMGFLLDDRGLPDQIVAGTYEVSVSVSPRNNFHFFSGRNSVPSSLFNVNIDGASGVQNKNVDTIVEYINPDGNYEPQALASGMTNRNHDVGSVHQAPNSVNRDTGIEWVSNGGNVTSVKLSLGGSAHAPFIIEGRTLSFSAKIVVPSGGVPKDNFTESIVFALWGGAPLSNPIVGLGGQQLFPTNYEDWTSQYSFDLGLQNLQSIDHETNDLSNKICAVGETGQPAPKGFFIVNKATPTFCLEPAMTTGLGNFSTGRYYGETGIPGKFQVDSLSTSGVQDSLYGVKLTLANLANVETKTCIPLPKQGFGSLVSPLAYVASQSAASSVSDPTEKIRAKRFGNIATSYWDYTGKTTPTSTRLVWPSTQRNLELPTAGSQGPACQVFDSDQNISSTTHLAGSVIEFTSDGGSLPMSGTITGLNFGLSGDFLNEFYETGTDLVTSERRQKWMPAPIGRWVVVEDAENKDLEFWSSQLGFNAYLDVDGSTEFATLYKQGRPNLMIPGISGRYEGTLSGANGSNGYSKILFSFSTYPNGTSFPELASRSVYSCIDGDAGPGGSSAFATRSFGQRGGGESDSWGPAFGRGTHSFSSSNSNTVGSHANISGSVTAFGLVGSCDNVPGMTITEIFRRGVNDFYNSSGINVSPTVVKQRMTQYTAYEAPFALSFPQLKTVVSMASLSEVIKEGQEFSAVEAGDQFNVGIRVAESYVDPEFFTPNFSPLDAFDAGLSYGTIGVIDSGFVNVERQVGLSDSFNGGGGAAFASAATDGSALFTSSFKTKANHEFGIVYFDKKGRHGAVQPIDSVYVKGYDERDGNSQGPATAIFKIKHAPPSWAENYKFVYAGNTNVERFLQYTVDGAHVREYEDNEGSNNIFLSLNTLQANDVSFQSSYSAVNQNDGSKDLYSFAEGDFLRVISYQDSSGNVVYPTESWQFQIVDKRRLSPLMEDHPLAVPGAGATNSGVTDLSKNGDFLILEDNPFALGFRRSDVENGADFWSSRCIVELVRPRKSLPDEALAYYEINYGGKCVEDSTNETGKSHEFQNHYIANGDIYYRSMPMNLQKYSDGEYVPVVNGTVSVDRSYSNFKSVFVEAEGWTDFFVSKERNYGRAHFANPKEAETTRPSSISFSEQTELGAYETRWLSFPRVGNYKDFNYVYGGIDIMDYDGVFMNTFFSDSILKVPYNRNFLMDGSEDALVASLKVFGTPRDVDYDGGTGGSPESLIRVDKDYFFVSPKRREVVMLQNRANPQVISNMNVSNYIKSEIGSDESAISKYPLGWDNVNKELIMTLYRGDVSTPYDPLDSRLRSMAFDLKTKKYWKTRYSFSSPMYSILGDNLISWHSGAGQFTHPWIHGKNAVSSNFYNEQHETKFVCHMNDQLNQSKKYDAIITDSDSAWNINLSAGNPGAEEELISSLSANNQKRYYGKWYAKSPRVDAGGTSATAPQRIPSENTSHLFHVPGFPFNSHNGLFIQPRIALRLVGDTYDVVQTSLPIPDGHPFWRTAFPNGKRSAIYERSKASGPGFDYNNPSGAFVSKTGSVDPQISTSTMLVTTSINEWKIAGVESNSVNFIEEEGVNDIVNNLIFEKPTSSLPSEVQSILQIAYLQNLDYAEDQNGWVYLDQIDFVNILGPSVTEYVRFILVNLLIQPTYALHFGPNGVENTGLAIALINGTIGGQLVYNEWDLNEDGVVSVADILQFLGSFGVDYVINDLLSLLENLGPIGDATYSDGFSLSAADAVTFIASVAPLTPDGYPVKKDLYSTYSGPTAGRDVRGRTLTMEFYDATSTPKDLFGIEVDYDLDVKTPRAAVGRRPARAQGRRR